MSKYSIYMKDGQIREVEGDNIVQALIINGMSTNLDNYAHFEIKQAYPSFRFDPFSHQWINLDLLPA